MAAAASLPCSALSAGNITALVVKGSATTKYREKLSQLVKFMNRNHLPHALREQMRRVGELLGKVRESVVMRVTGGVLTGRLCLRHLIGLWLQ